MSSSGGWRRARRFVYEALIVPSAHTRVLDAEFQGELYEVFHTRPLARWGHAICTPIANVALLALASEITVQLASGGGQVVLDGGIVGALVALAFYVAVHGAWALAMAAPLAVAVLAAHALHGALGAHVVPAALAIAGGAAMLQTLSHIAEPVPPPWASGHRFGPVREVLRRSPVSRIVALAVASLLVFPVLELWAAPRIWPLQLAHALGRVGWFRARAERMAERVRAIHEDARAGWETPSMPGDEPR